MTKLEYLAVLRSMELAIDLGSKDDVQKLIKQLIADAEGTRKEKETEKK